ncbi:MAG: transglutaminase domain-containing protein, partial [bacterium]|nr:transglutaminase domain-containing protein [bacterium]
FIAHYDYPRFARFVERMRGREIPLADLDALYRGITHTRVQKKLMDAYGHTGRTQMEDALRTEAGALVGNIETLTRSQKVLKALKAHGLSEDAGLMATEERDRMLVALSGDERALVGNLQAAYREYVQRGDEGGYEQLVRAIQDGMPKLQKTPESGKPSEGMEQLEQELEPFMEQAVPPGAPEDPAIPPEDHDEYHTPPPAPGESKEQMRVRPIFEITPPLGGYYASGRKSYFDITTKTWSKKKRLTPYGASLAGKERSTISGALDAGLKSIPIPNGHGLDVSTLKYSGARPEIFRDQNGCFYLEAKGPGSFSIDFLPENPPCVGPPIQDDTAALYRGSLSTKTEATISRLIGSPAQKAEQARQYILANHFYPGGGDLQAAQALQYKLRAESTGDNYLQNIDASEYLECYSANTKFIAMMRKAGVSARLVVGHKVEGAKDGKSAITESTGHAWAEIWDGKAWRRVDATPNPKPEDKRKDEKDKKKEEGKQEAAPDAQDGGVERPQDTDEGQEAGGEGKPEGKPEKGQAQSAASENPLEQMGDASDSDVQQSESQVQQAREQMDKMTQQKQQLEQKAEAAEKFQDLADLQKEIEQSELLDDQKQELQDKVEAKEELMKDAIKDELDKMVDDGFLDEKRRDEMIEKLDQKKLEELDRVQQEIERENALYNEYEDIREEVAPLVEKWFKYFAERLPRQEEVSVDEDSLTRQGVFNRRAIMRARNLLFGLVRNPREIRPSVKPRFMASILVDVSGSMAGAKLMNARKLLVFYSELFSRISQVFGYIRFSINIFSDSVTEIKGFGHEYDAPRRYDFPDGTQSTVKVRLMQRLTTAGGTNMLDGIRKAAGDLTKEVEEFPDYASALYFVGDGGDTQGNATNIRNFLRINDAERGFGEHMYAATLLGDESQRQVLAEIFGDEHTSVAPDFDELIEKSMDRFDGDLDEYLKTKTQ